MKHLHHHVITRSLAALVVPALVACSTGADRAAPSAPSVGSALPLPSAPSSAASTDTPMPQTTTTTTPIDVTVRASAVPTAIESIADAGNEAAVATETVHLVTHAGRVFAGLGRWMAPAPFGAPIVVQDAPDQPWRTFVQCCDSNRPSRS